MYVMATFHDELPNILARRALTKASASVALGMDRTYLGKILSSRGEMGMTPLLSLAELVGLTVEQLVTGSDPFKIPIAAAEPIGGPLWFSKKTIAKRAKLISVKDEPPYEEFYSWFVNTGGDINLLGHLSDFVDVYRFAGARQTRPILLSMGAKSLAARALKSPSLATLAALLDSAPRSTIVSVMQGHKRAVQFGVYSNEEQLLFPSGHEDLSSLTYWRTLFRAKDGTETLVVNYCKTIGYEMRAFTQLK